MKCELCHETVEGLICLRFYTRQGIEVCAPCYQLVQRHRGKPYSRVMDRMAEAEAGYPVNRKLARLSMRPHR